MGRRGITASLVVRDHGMRRFQALVRDLAKSDPHVKVGVLEEKGGGEEVEGTGITMAGLAAIHEFGAPDANIPERSFIRASFDQNRDKYRQRLRTYLKAIIAGKMTAKRAFGLLGAEAASDIRQFVRAGVEPPNAPSTAWRKLKGQRDAATSATRELDRLTDSHDFAGMLGRREQGPQLPGASDFRRTLGRARSRVGRTLSALESAAAKVKPLIDTGRMVGAVTYAVVVKGGL